MLEFSVNQPEINKQYTKRPGAYGVIKHADSLIAIIKTKTGYFLPGGGIEGEELPDECLRRECLEEIGVEISDLNYFACGNYFFYSTTLNVDMESVGHFFTCRIDKFLEISSEDDHELVWLDIEQVIPLMYLDNQREAIKIFKERSI